jgi:hypothetical protein
VLAAIALLAWQRAPRLLHDLRILDETVSARERTWTSGMDPGSSSMDFYNGPARWLTNYWRLTPGEIYRLDAPADEAPPDMNHARSVARFFGKSELRAH